LQGPKWPGNLHFAIWPNNNHPSHYERPSLRGAFQLLGARHFGSEAISKQNHFKLLVIEKGTHKAEENWQLFEGQTSDELHFV